MAQPGVKYIPSKKDKIDVYNLACQGATDKLICETLNIDRGTFKRNLHLFSRYLKRGQRIYNLHLYRELPDVVSALLRRCTGYEYEEVSTKQKGKVVNGVLLNGDIERTVTKPFKTERPVFQVIDTKTKELCESIVAGNGRESQKPPELPAAQTMAPDGK